MNDTAAVYLKSEECIWVEGYEYCQLLFTECSRTDRGHYLKVETGQNTVVFVPESEVVKVVFEDREKE